MNSKETHGQELIKEWQQRNQEIRERAESKKVMGDLGIKNLFPYD
jgi:DNA-directed RNA polymerase subunit N (RpoN/RPB10)